MNKIERLLVFYNDLYFIDSDHVFDESISGIAAQLCCCQCGPSAEQDNPGDKA